MMSGSSAPVAIERRAGEAHAETLSAGSQSIGAHSGLQAHTSKNGGGSASAAEFHATSSHPLEEGQSTPVISSPAVTALIQSKNQAIPSGGHQSNSRSPNAPSASRDESSKSLRRVDLGGKSAPVSSRKKRANAKPSPKTPSQPHPQDKVQRWSRGKATVVLLLICALAIAMVSSVTVWNTRTEGNLKAWLLAKQEHEALNSVQYDTAIKKPSSPLTSFLIGCNLNKYEERFELANISLQNLLELETQSLLREAFVDNDDFKMNVFEMKRLHQAISITNSAARTASIDEGEGV